MFFEMNVLEALVGADCAETVVSGAAAEDVAESRRRAAFWRLVDVPVLHDVAAVFRDYV